MDALGIDIGGVIIDRVNDGTDTSFFCGNHLATTAVPVNIQVPRNSYGAAGRRAWAGMSPTAETPGRRAAE